MLLKPTIEEFKKFPKQTRNIFYWNITKEDNKELYSLIPEGVKKQQKQIKDIEKKQRKKSDYFKKKEQNAFINFLIKIKLLKI